MITDMPERGLLSIMYSCDTKPLQYWDKTTRNGIVKRVIDEDLHSSALDIVGTNACTTYITCPRCPDQPLRIKMPILVLVIKNMKKYVRFVVQVIDDKDVRRRFRVSNYLNTCRVQPVVCTVPLRLQEGWNQVQFDLADFTRQAYGTVYVETVRLQIHANCRLRRVYFSDRAYSEEELPVDYRLYQTLSIPEEERPKE